MSGMIFLECLIIFISGYLSKNKLSILVYVLMLTILPLICIGIMIAEFRHTHDFLGYLSVIVFAGASFLSIWVFPAMNGELKKVEASMYFVVVIILLIYMTLFALVEVLPNDIIESILRPLILKGNTYDILSRPSYQLAHFVVMAGCFPYIASFIISKTILKFRNYQNQ
ncbi:hypothetical protein DEAC_c42900 [Desulfosporosinus acididurans]|uniref:Uncharacterized protein n=1 Tax=Desulfosporosinus acididurans TaxID=476652 RepID=A0A0J1FLI2_9FIRM|nr:hypothetical protein [Desulfosporosinus acididurans]KLU63798.1 hypothetical protein DEAC_c42900 [Desulfosporosinus acididurans]